MIENIKELTTFIWNIAELLRGDFKQSKYSKVILPFIILRELDCVIVNNQINFKEKYKEAKQQFASDMPETILYSFNDSIVYEKTFNKNLFN